MNNSFDEIKQEIFNGESTTVEFKASTSQLSRSMETLCGFLNNSGGTVYIGIEDSGKIIGQHVSDKTKREISSILSFFEPHYDICIKYVPIPYNDKQIIAMTALPHVDSRPYAYKGRAYYREGTSTLIMPQSKYEKILKEKFSNQIVWDEQIATDYNISELDSSLINKIVERGINANRIPREVEDEGIDGTLLKLGLLENNNITNAAVALFGNNFLPSFSQCHLRLAKYQDHQKLQLEISDHIYGNIFNLLEKANEFIRQNISVSSYFTEDSITRHDLPDYPPIAVREALVNAFCHRNYCQNSGSISVEIFPKHLEISSFGRLPSGITIDMLNKQHNSIQRNKLISSVLYKSGYIESYGTGTQKILTLCKKAKMNSPEFIEDGGFFIVKMYKADINKFTHLNNTSTIDKVNDNSEKRQKEIISVLQKYKSLSNKEILNQISYEISDRTLRYDLEKLSNKGLVIKVGKGRGLKWGLKDK